MADKSNNFSSKASKAKNKIFRFITDTTTLKYLGCIAALSLVAEGWLCYFLCGLNFRDVVLSTYYIIFGVLAFCGEWNLKFIKNNISILASYAGRASFYLFFGVLAITSKWWTVCYYYICIYLYTSYPTLTL